MIKAKRPRRYAYAEFRRYHSSLLGDCPSLRQMRRATARTHIAAVRNFAVDTPEGRPKALQTSECNELLGLTRAVCLIAAQRQPGKFIPHALSSLCTTSWCTLRRTVRYAAESNGQKIEIRKAPQTRQRLVKGETLVREMRRTQRRVQTIAAKAVRTSGAVSVASSIGEVTQPDVLR